MKFAMSYTKKANSKEKITLLLTVANASTTSSTGNDLYSITDKTRLLKSNTQQFSSPKSYHPSHDGPNKIIQEPTITVVITKII
jgi:hypothetical protein